jgi:hypothetical protein
MIVTGNPFAISGDSTNYNILKNILDARGSSLINETLAGPSYLRRSSGAPRGIPPLPIAQANQQQQKLKYDRVEEEKLFNDTAVNDQNRNPNDPAFFLTEDPNMQYMYV